MMMTTTSRCCEDVILLPPRDHADSLVETRRDVILPPLPAALARPYFCRVVAAPRRGMKYEGATRKLRKGGGDNLMRIKPSMSESYESTK